MSRPLRHVAAALALALVPSAEALLAQQTPADWFVSFCSRCHGIEGKGGDGPSLHRAELESAATDDELFSVIQNGIPGTGMPGTWQLSDKQTRELVTYVRGMGQVEPEPLPGDPRAGESLYADLGCEACHVLEGVGRGIGPELTRIGLMRGIEHLRESLTKPAETISEDYLFVRARFADGATLEGLRVNEDDFSLQIRDANGAFHSVRKGDLERLDRLRKRTIMRSYARSLDRAELDDLVSYLASLRGPTAIAKEGAE